MATFTYGFYNAIEGDRAYDAIQMSEIFDGVIADGIYETIGDRFIVKENLNENDSVIIGSGRAWFNHTWNKLDVSMLFIVPSPDTLARRIDAIVIEVNEVERTNSIKVVMGTPATNPVKPILENANGVFQHPLCYITRIPGVAKVEQQHIENCVGTTETPWVIGVIDTIDASELYLQWTVEWRAFRKNVDDGWDQIQKEWESVKNKTKEEQEAVINEMRQWILQKQVYINNWIEEDIKGKLGEEPATALQMQINEIQEHADQVLYDFESRVTYEEEDGTIVQEINDGRKLTTKRLENGDYEQKFYLSDGSLWLTKNVHEDEDGRIIETVV